MSVSALIRPEDCSNSILLINWLFSDNNNNKTESLCIVLNVTSEFNAFPLLLFFFRIFPTSVDFKFLPNII